METLPLPPSSKPSPTSSLQFRPLTPPPTCSYVVDSSLPLPSDPSLLSTYPLFAFTLPSTPPSPTSTQPINNSLPHPQQTPHPSQNLRILQWNAGGLSPSRRAELIAFLSNNQYDLILLQEAHFLATKNFQIPGYSTLRTNRTFDRQVSVSFRGHYTVVVSSLLSTLTWPSLMFLSPLFLPRTPTQTKPALKFFFPTTLPYNSLISTPLPSGSSLLTSFKTPLTLLFLEIAMLTT